MSICLNEYIPNWLRSVQYSTVPPFTLSILHSPSSSPITSLYIATLPYIRFNIQKHHQGRIPLPLSSLHQTKPQAQMHAVSQPSPSVSGYGAHLTNRANVFQR